MTTVLSEVSTGEPILATGAVGTTDMTFKQMRGLSRPAVKGVDTGTGLKVTQRGSGANMSVDVSAGFTWVPGTVDLNPSGQNNYGCPSDAVVNLNGITAPVSTPRRDIIVMRAYDEGDAPNGSGRSAACYLQYIKNATESLTAEAAPANSQILAYCDMPVGAASVINAYITDARSFSGPRIVGKDGKTYTMQVDANGFMVLRNVTDGLDLWVPGDNVAEATDNTNFSTANASEIEVTGANVTVAGTGQAVSVEARANLRATGGAGAYIVRLYSGANLGAGVLLDTARMTAQVNNDYLPPFVLRASDTTVSLVNKRYFLSVQTPAAASLVVYNRNLYARAN